MMSINSNFSQFDLTNVKSRSKIIGVEIVSLTLDKMVRTHIRMIFTRASSIELSYHDSPWRRQDPTTLLC